MDGLSSSLDEQEPLKAEDGQVEQLARSEPDHVPRMVRDVVSSFGMGKHR